MSDDPIERFRRAAVRWAAGGRGQPLVDAAAQALVDGLDSPALRMLAGAPAAAADEDADAYATESFEELGLDVATRNSERAIVDGARERARDFLAGEVGGRALARELYRAYVAAGYPEELNDWSGLDDWYDLVESKVIAGDAGDVDAAVRRCAEALAAGRSERSVDVGELFVAGSTDSSKARIRRLRWWRR